jgi:hypothetical protein
MRQAVSGWALQRIHAFPRHSHIHVQQRLAVSQTKSCRSYLRRSMSHDTTMCGTPTTLLLTNRQP